LIGEIEMGTHPGGAALGSGRADVAAVAHGYLAAVSDHDLERALAYWAEGARQNVRGQVDTTAPEGLREHIGGLLVAVPDARFEIVNTVVDESRCAVQWRLTGTFDGSLPFYGIAPTGHRLELEGIDLFTIRDGRIQRNDAFSDTMNFARQIGMLPARGSRAERTTTAFFNLKTRLARRLTRRRAR
jgi:predicted ester cyclase